MAKRKPPNAGRGRKRGVPNVVTGTVREMLQAFVENNAPKVQALFDKVAKQSPSKALDIYFRSAEFALPKLIRAEHVLPPAQREPIVVKSAAEEAFEYLNYTNDLGHPGYVVDYERKTAEPVPAVSPELLPTLTPTLPPAFEPRLDNESGPLMSLADPTPEPPPVRVADPDDGSIVEVVLSPEQIADADLRQQHIHTPKADSTCPGCKHLWVIS